MPCTTSDAEMRQLYGKHLEDVQSLIEIRPTMSMIKIDHRAMMEDPTIEAGKINAYLGGHLDVAKMAMVVELDFYRNRASW